MTTANVSPKDRKGPGDGVTTVHSFNIPALTSSTIQARIINRVDSSDYIDLVQGAGSSQFQVAVATNFASFTITLGATAAALFDATHDLQVNRITPQAQELSIPYDNNLPPKSLERGGLDKIVQMLQENTEAQGRNVTISITTPDGFSTELPAPSSSPGQAIVVKADGTGFEFSNTVLAIVPGAVVITAGSINGVAIGASNPGAGTFTDLTVTGTAIIPYVNTTTGLAAGTVQAAIDEIYTEAFSNGGYYTNGYYFTTGLRYSSGGNGISANFQRSYPFVVLNKTTFTRIGLDVETLELAKSARVAIYTWENGAPKNLVVDAGTVSLATTGQKEAVINTTLERGVYALCVVTDSAGTVRLRATQSDSLSSLFCPQTSSISVLNVGTEHAKTFGAFPTVCTATANDSLSSGSSNLMWLRKV